MRLPLAQIDANAVAVGLTTNPLAWLLTMALVTIGFLSREILSAKNAAIQAANDATKAANDATRLEVSRAQTELEARMAMMEKLLPLADKLVDGIRACERIVDKAGPR